MAKRPGRAGPARRSRARAGPVRCRGGPPRRGFPGAGLGSDRFQRVKRGRRPAGIDASAGATVASTSRGSRGPRPRARSSVRGSRRARRRAVRRAAALDTLSSVPASGRPSGCRGPDGGGQQFLGDLRGLVLVHQDFLADDAPLALDLDRRQARVLVKIGQHVAQLRQPSRPRPWRNNRCGPRR